MTQAVYCGSVQLLGAGAALTLPPQPERLIGSKHYVSSISRHTSNAFPFIYRKQRRACGMYLNSVNLNSFILRHVSLHSGFNHIKGFS